MAYKRPTQKLVAFTENSSDFETVKTDMKNGWNIISLVKNGNYYVGIMEQPERSSTEPDSFFIPPRKKIKISS